MKKWWKSGSVAFGFVAIFVYAFITLLVSGYSTRFSYAAGDALSPSEINDNVNKFYTQKAIEACRDAFQSASANYPYVTSSTLNTPISSNAQGSTNIKYTDANGDHKCTLDEISSQFKKLGRDEAGRKIGEAYENAPEVDINGAKLKYLTVDKLVDILNSELRNADRPTINQAVYWEVYNNTFERCTEGGYSDKPTTDIPSQEYQFSGGTTGKPGPDGKLTAGTVYIKKNSDGQSNKSFVVYPGSNALTCGEIYDNVNARFDSYIDNYNRYVDKVGGANAEKPGVVDTGNEDNSSGDGDDGTDKCEASTFGFGWILCPGSTIITTFASWLLSFIASQLNWTMLADSSDTIIPIWQKFLAIANVVFAIAFIVMIYSMATSTGLSNYDVKKLLPRLIIVAIAVNLSFYICAAMVDLSNIAGQGIFTLMTSLTSTKSSGDIFTTILGGVGQIFAGAEAVIATVVAVGYFGGTLAVGLMVILCCVFFRQLALTVLVLISPIAFALYMLPNTEKWGKKWMDLFVRMLLVFPMFMAVWGGSILMANILTITNGANIQNFIIGSICAFAPAVAIIPLFKMSGGLMGMVTGAIAGSAVAKYTQEHGNKAVRGAVKRGVPGRMFSSTAGRLGNSLRGFEGDGLIARGARAVGNTQVLRNAEAMNSKAIEARRKEATEAGVTWAKNSGLTFDQMKEAYTNMGKYTDSNGEEQYINDQYKLAALGSIVKDGLSADDWHSVMKNANILSERLQRNGQAPDAQYLRDTVASDMISSKGSALSNKDINSWASQTDKFKDNNFDEAYDMGIASTAKGVTANEMGKMSSGKRKHIMEHLEESTVTSPDARTDTNAGIYNMASAAQAAASSPRISSGMTGTTLNAMGEIAETAGRSVGYADIGSMSESHTKAINDYKNAESQYSQSMQQLAAAKQSYDEASANYNNIVNSSDGVDLAEVSEAKAKLNQAESVLNTAKASVNTAHAALNKSQAALESSASRARATRSALASHGLTSENMSGQTLKKLDQMSDTVRESGQLSPSVIDEWAKSNSKK